MEHNYAVMGNPIAHSLSPIIHHLFAEQIGCSLIYEKILIDEECFEQQVIEFFDNGGKGLNITLPCKQRAFAMSKRISPRCLQAKSANTLWMQADDLHADNTDGAGLLRDLKRYVDLSGKHILLLGAGGAARGVINPLLAANPLTLTIANRTLQTAQALQKEFPKIISCGLEEINTSYEIMINATAASLDNQILNIPKTALKAKPFCYDLAYLLKGQTPFVAWAERNNCKAIDGLGMLIEQAAEAFFIWHKVMPDTASVLKLLR